MDQAVTSRESGRGVAAVAALAFVFWGMTALFLFVYIPSQHGRELDGLAYLPPLVMLAGASVLLSVDAGAWALGMALRQRDWLSAVSAGILLAAAAFAGHALWQNGHPSHPVVSLVYGFPTDRFSLHPLAFYGSAALIPAIAPVAFAYALTSGKARQISAAVGPLAVLGLWIAIRIAG